MFSYGLIFLAIIWNENMEIMVCHHWIVQKRTKLVIFRNRAHIFYYGFTFPVLALGNGHSLFLAIAVPKKLLGTFWTIFEIFSIFYLSFTLFLKNTFKTLAIYFKIKAPEGCLWRFTILKWFLRTNC